MLKFTTFTLTYSHRFSSPTERFWYVDGGGDALACAQDIAKRIGATARATRFFSRALLIRSR